MIARPRIGVSEVVCLCYHAVSERWPCSLAVEPRQLQRHLHGLVRRGWVGATFSQAVLEPPAPRTLAITFDDAFASVIELALPILSELGLPATVFAPTAFMSSRQSLSWEGIERWTDTPYANELMSMDWDDLLELAGHGWEIGSHARTHPRLTALDDATLATELTASLQDCERHLGGRCRAIAYPYGDVDRRVAAGAREAGYEVGAGLSRSLRVQDRHVWPRVGIYRADDDWRVVLKLSVAMRRARSSRLWPGAPASHAALRGAPRRRSASV